MHSCPFKDKIQSIFNNLCFPLLLMRKVLSLIAFLKCIRGDNHDYKSHSSWKNTLLVQKPKGKLQKRKKQESCGEKKRWKL